MLKVIFAGTPDFSVPCLQALLDSEHQVVCVLTQPDRPAGRGRKLTASPIKQLATQAKIPVIQVKTLRDDVVQQQLKDFNADVMVVVAYGLILPKKVLDIPRLGCVNVHASLLPRWRGAAPIQRAIAAGDQQTGVTIMQMDVGLDTGDMLLIEKYAIKKTDTAQDVHDQLSNLGAKALITGLQQLEQGKAVPVKQDDARATYAEKLSKQEAQIDWQLAATTIANNIRAFNPWPIAFTHIEGQVLRVWQAQVIAQHAEAQPGTILNGDKHGIDVATGDGILRLQQLQLPGGKALSAQQLLNSKQALFTAGQQLQ